MFRCQWRCEASNYVIARDLLLPTLRLLARFPGRRYEPIATGSSAAAQRTCYSAAFNDLPASSIALRAIGTRHLYSPRIDLVAKLPQIGRARATIFRSAFRAKLAQDRGADYPLYVIFARALFVQGASEFWCCLRHKERFCN
jgi:hypothetical protein